MIVMRVNAKLRFEYTNHRNETSMREVMFKGMDFGSNEWYPTPQWLLRGFDSDRGAERSFALGRINTDTLTVL